MSQTTDSSNVSRREAVKEYLESTVVPVLSRALTDMCVQQPEDPFKWLARWLIENHPTSPQQAEWCETLVHKLAQGDFFGEIALLSGKPRQATVKAVGTVTLLVLSRDAFTRLCGNLFEILRRNMESYKSIEIPEANTDDAKEQNGPEEENEDDEPPTPPPVNVRRGRRGTVFVEAAQIEDGWTPPSYPKSEDEIQRLDEHISKTALLAYLDPKARTTVIEAFEKKNFSAGEDIIRQGDDGDYYYILDAGKADVLLAKPLGSEPFKVNEYGPGGSFGELALLHGEPRNATIRTTESCVTWALDRDTFRKIMMQSGKQDMNDRLQFLSKVSLLAELTQYEKFKIAEAMKLRSAEPGETIIKEGDVGNEFFIIQSGNVNCYKRTLKF
uniref:Cyclic nucleotide-binding domain-containing protein n=1 Tax=Hanusia phi TaxID=3032 RepID=A0A7S0DYM5_9CRYP